MTAVELVKLWLAIRPIRRLKERRAAKRAARKAESDAAGGEFLDFDDEEEGTMNEQIQSVIRTVLKAVGGTAVGAGIVTDGQLEILAGAASIIIGLVWSWWSKRSANPA